MGANIEIKNSRDDYEPSADILVKSSRLDGIDLDEKLISNLIDELPVLFIAAAFANGLTKIRGAEELRTKESDRLEAMSKSLSALGVNYDLFEDGIDIKGNSNFNKSVKINSFGDHRIAMASAVACSMIDGDNIIENVNNVSTSFPNFVQISNSIGMDIDHI
jgi:3-phosphoshikimate 1-carboxyvinyltransferase